MMKRIILVEQIVIESLIIQESLIMLNESHPIISLMKWYFLLDLMIPSGLLVLLWLHLKFLSRQYFVSDVNLSIFSWAQSCKPLVMRSLLSTTSLVPFTVLDYFNLTVTSVMRVTIMRLTIFLVLVVHWVFVLGSGISSVLLGHLTTSSLTD